MQGWVVLVFVLGFALAPLASAVNRYKMESAACSQVGTSGLSRFSSELVHHVPPPDYVATMSFESIVGWFKEYGWYQFTEEALHESYQRGYDELVIKVESPSPLLGAWQFVPPTPFQLIKKLGSGDKGTVFLAQDSSGHQVAIKIPVGRVTDKAKASLTLNLELEFWINVWLRKQYDRYRIKVIPILEFGEQGSYMMTEWFDEDLHLAVRIDRLIRSEVPTDLREKFYDLARQNKRAELGPLFRQIVLKFLPVEIVQQLQDSFLGVQRLALDTGMHIDFVTDNVAFIDRQVVLFDTGIRFSEGVRRHKLTLGPRYDGTEASIQGFEDWLEISHYSWMMKAGQLPRH